MGFTGITITLAVVIFHSSLVCSNPLTDIIEEKEHIVNRLAQAVEFAYNNRCSRRPEKQCLLSACGSTKPGMEQVCATDFGSTTVTYDQCSYSCTSRKLDIGTSSVLTPSPPDTYNILFEGYWTTDLQETFYNTYLDDRIRNIQASTLQWQYFATVSGLIRLFPAFAQERCYTLDPRIRPWYVAATSGPKNVVLVIDTSASMLNSNRLTHAREAAVTVVGTLTNVDYAAVIVFNDNAQQIHGAQQDPGTLLRTTYTNIDTMTRLIRDIEANPIGQTNFEAAFRKVFDILDNISPNNSANCHTVVMFLTDGFPNRGTTSEDALITLIKQRNTMQARIFTYTFGSESGAALARGIACQTGGLYAHIANGNNLRDQLSQYYDYFASLKTSTDDKVTWVEPYQDAIGAGRLVTASKAVYTNDTVPQLIGVVGIDIHVSILEAAANETGLNYQDIISQLASRNICPDLQTLQPCALNAIRVREGGVACDDGEVCGEPSQDFHCNYLILQNVSFCDYQEQRFIHDPNLYREESCCFNDSTQITNIGCSGEESLLPIKSTVITLSFITGKIINAWH